MFNTECLLHIIQFLPPQDTFIFHFINKKCDAALSVKQPLTFVHLKLCKDQSLNIPETITKLKLSCTNDNFIRAFMSLHRLIHLGNIKVVILHIYKTSLAIVDKILEHLPNDVKIILEIVHLDEGAVEKYKNNPQCRIGGISTQLNESILRNNVVILPERCCDISGKEWSNYISFDTSMFELYKTQIWKKYYPVNVKLTNITTNEKSTNLKNFLFNSVVLEGRINPSNLVTKHLHVFNNIVPSCVGLYSLYVDTPYEFDKYTVQDQLRNLCIHYAKDLTEVNLSSANENLRVSFVCCKKLNHLEFNKLKSVNILDCPINSIKCNEIDFIQLFGADVTHIDGVINDLKCDNDCYVNGVISHHKRLFLM
ncbi:F-box domain-containing protein [Entamoeba marina]